MSINNTFLYVLALALLLAVIVLVYLFFAMGSLTGPSFANSLDEARAALNSGKNNVFRREIMRAGKHAAGYKEWNQLLSLAASGIQDKDYGLFTAMARRAVVKNPGNNNLLAYWVWGLLRDGKTQKAAQYALALDENVWSTLQSEVRIKSLIGEGTDDLQLFSKQLEEKLDPDFFSYASSITGSAELAVDSALMYMQIGDTKKAYDMAWVVINGNRTWYDRDKIPSSTIAMAKIAYDNSYYDDAAAWLSAYKQEISKEWDELQFAGDVYWQLYNQSAEKKYARESLIYWNKAINIIKKDKENIPSSSWPVWLNRTLAFYELHSLERGDESLQEALTLFPQTSQVQAAWAVVNAKNYPSLAHRILQSEERDPVLIFTTLKIEPVPGNPRVYESTLWELFDEITGNGNFLEADSRNITLFLMNYLRSRNDFASIDIVLRRYRNKFGNEEWMLPWILVNDTVAGIPIIDLLPDSPGGMSKYEQLRQVVKKRMDWKALYDLVLYSLFAIKNLNNIQSGYQTGKSETDDSLFEAAALLWLSDNIKSGESGNPNLAGRVNRLAELRKDLAEHLKTLKQRGQGRRAAVLSVKASINHKINELLENSMEDIKMAYSQEAADQDYLDSLEELVMKEKELALQR